METKLEHETKESSEQKYEQEFLQKIEGEANEAIKKIPEKNRQEIRQKADDALCSLSLDLSPAKSAVLRLKLLQYFQENNEIDIAMLRQAIFETPNFLKGPLKNLVENYKTKTIKQTREEIKKRINLNDKESYNPYLIEFETNSGRYYLARLLNQPHLEQEGKEMHHCIGAPTSASSYIYRMKAGDIDTFSFKEKEGDKPVITFEYNRIKRSLTQIKKVYEAKLLPSDPFFGEFIEVLKKMEETTDDDGKKRKITSVYREASEDIIVAPNHLCTERGEIPFSEYDPKKDALVLSGKIEMTKETTGEETEFISKIPSVATNLTNLRPEIKHGITEWAGNMTDSSSVFLYDNLVSVNGFVEAKTAKDFQAPQLEFVGESLNTGEAVEFNMPNLTSVGGLLNAFRARVFKAPLLQTVDGPISATSAEIFEAPVLKKAKYIGLSKTITEENISLSREMHKKIQR
ncbi:MAG: PcfJ domain-containing protein [Candidatus Parcubacteria bacterium]|nr:PcfJ domain-containing protein [Candidatus Parcubacteria bacterium]